jgi:hypothetical protein
MVMMGSALLEGVDFFFCGLFEHWEDLMDGQALKNL